MHRNTVARWRRRFDKACMDGLVDEPRCGPPRTVSDDEVEKLVTETLGEDPDGRHPLLDPLDGGVSEHVAVGGLAGCLFGLAPHETETTS